jgi:hypothetical protein
MIKYAGSWAGAGQQPDSHRGHSLPTQKEAEARHILNEVLDTYCTICT